MTWSRFREGRPSDALQAITFSVWREDLAKLEPATLVATNRARELASIH